MLLYRSLENVSATSGARVVAIGVFDGLHVGHQRLMTRARALARERGARATVLTFEPTPREVLTPNDPPARLTSFRERFDLLTAMQIDELCCLRFNQVQQLDPAAFIDSLLVGRLNASAIVVGDDFRFGLGREGAVGDLVAAGEHNGFDVHQIAPVQRLGRRVSSTAVRQALSEGRLEDARTMLGRDYSISGKVARGLALGRELGFPTANIPLRRRVVALSGVFAVRVAGLGGRLHDGVASLGTRPTIGGDRVLLEAHLFDFDGDIYGRRIEVQFVAKLRDEEKFPNLEEMRAQMHIDAESARAALRAAIA